MRSTLATLDGERKRFTATFVRIGKKTNYKGYSEDTILLQHVTDLATQEVVTDHLWFTYTKAFEDAGIREGDRIAFDARIKSYKKGYVNKSMNLRKRQTDYKLSHPTRIEILERQAGNR